MFRKHLIAVTLLTEAITCAALMAQPVDWVTDVEEGMGKAKGLGVPVLFYLDTAEKDAADSGDAQERSFADGVVSTIVRERFVPVRLRKSATTEVMLKQLEAKEVTPFTVLVATPRGHLVGTIPASQVAKPDTFADQLAAMFRKYRTSVFERNLKPTLEDQSAKADQLIEALKVIEELLIVEADSSVLQLLDRKQLSEDARERAYQTLAVLSTKPTVEALLAAAPGDEAAAAALSKCTPDAAEVLLPKLDPAKPDVAILVYKAVTRICKVDALKPELFMEDAPQEAQRQEIERVKRAVTQAAHRWREEHKAVR
ncbi:MAG: hypothetical protein JSU86_15690 [Phycisphaerales bacterium]|nr:MAG: hypothetical protein JSU86_15690 [Phycisphaerales bacterium]